MLVKFTTKSILLLAKGIHSMIQSGFYFKLYFLFTQYEVKWKSVTGCNDSAELVETPKKAYSKKQGLTKSLYKVKQMIMNKLF